MASPSPNKSIDTFKSSVDEHSRRFAALTDLVSGSDGADGLTELQLRRGLAVDYFFRVATDWQVFQDEWSVRAIAHRPARLLDAYTERFESELNATKAAKGIRLFTDVAISVPSLGAKLAVERVRQIVDANERNLEFANCETWAKWARLNLAEPHKSTLLRLLADDANASLLDLVRQLRNFIAHRSTSSLKEIQQFAAKRPADGVVGITGDENLPITVERQNRIRDVGTYLDRGLGAPHFTPARFFAARLIELAEHLRWS